MNPVLDMPVVVPALDEPNTRQVSDFGHRLALGVQWREALSGQAARGSWLTDLEAIGPRPLAQRFTAHAQGRHALLHRGPLARLLAAGAHDKLMVPPATVAADPTNFVLLGHSPALARRHVPRRLSFTPVQTGGIPPATLDNIRTAWLWPGADGAVPANATVVRGRIRRVDGLGVARPVAWARVTLTRPALALPPPDFGTEPHIAWAHGDDRGEFLAVLGPAMLGGGAALPASVVLTLWVHLPSLLPAFDPQTPLAGLPLEVAGVAASSPVLEGKQAPSDYLRQPGVRIILPLGGTTVLADGLLQF